jgi:uncharacterized protein YndB with AHSA1/START domain
MTGVVLTTPSEREIGLSRTFDAPRTLLFGAWTQPALLMRWLGAHGWRLVECTVDLRVGGAWRFGSRGPDGAFLGHGGVYVEVEPPARLVYTEVFDEQSYPGQCLVRHDFTEHSGRTTVRTTLTFPSVAARDIVLGYPMARGLGQGYDRLAVLLVQKGQSA